MQGELDAAAKKAADALDAAKAEAQKAQQAADAADAKVAEAQKAADAAQAAAAESSQKLSDGAFAFFKDMGADDALAVLESKTVTSAYTGASLENLTQKGSANDSTSIVNMQATIAFLKECNALRSNAENADKNLPELKVTLIDTAYAMWDANWSQKNIGHAGAFRIGENLAFGYSDPFTGWYDAEKKLYEADPNTDQAGHYLNIIENYDLTGYAINTKPGAYRNTHSQVFEWAKWSANKGAKTYTVDEYAKLLNDWVDAQKKAPSEYQAKLAELKAAQGEARPPPTR